jgi:hypothetical protein
VCRAGTVAKPEHRRGTAVKAPELIVQQRENAVDPIPRAVPDALQRGFDSTPRYPLQLPRNSWFLALAPIGAESPELIFKPHYSPV